MIEKLYTVEEVAELASVTGRTIRNYQKNGRLTGRKIGGQWRFTQSEVQRLLSGEAQPAPSVGMPETELPPEDDSVNYSFGLPEAEPPENFEETSPAQGASVQEPSLEPPTPAPTDIPTQPAPPHMLPNIPSEQPNQPPPPVAQQVPQPQQQPIQQPQQIPQPQQQQLSQPMVAPQPPPPAYAGVYSPPMQPQPYAPVAQQPLSFEQPFAQYPAQSYAPMGPLQAPVYGNTPAFVYAAQGQPQPMPAVPLATPSAADEEDVPVERPRARKSKRQRDAFSELSDVGRRVATFASEVHDCSEGPQICAMIDMHQSLAAAKATSERLADFARQESDSGIVCRAFVEFDTRYYIARYTLFGTSAFLSRCLMLIG